MFNFTLSFSDFPHTTDITQTSLKVPMQRSFANGILLQQYVQQLLRHCSGVPYFCKLYTASFLIGYSEHCFIAT